MKVTDALLGEHAVLYRLLDYSSRSLRAWNLAQLREGGALIAAALLGHARLEDEILFTALEPQLPTRLGILATLREEHEQIEGALVQLAEAKDVASARALFAQAAETARLHFAKEEQVLFHLAASCLGEARLLELGRAWADIAVPVPA
jgi:hemerythrin HHE cation binding domain-containing protein